MCVLCEEYGVSAATLYAGRRLYSGLPSTVVARMQALSVLNARLQKQVRDLECDNDALRKALQRNETTPAQRRELVKYMTSQLGVTHTKACKFANISRSFFAYQDQKEVDASAQSAREAPHHYRTAPRPGAWDVTSAPVVSRVVAIEETRHAPVETNGRDSQAKSADKAEYDNQVMGQLRGF